jgi:hypothetical protein
MRKKLKLSPDGGDSGSKKCKRRYGGAYGGVWRKLRLAGVRRSVSCWCLWQKSGFSRREDVFSFNLFHRHFINFVLSMRFAKIKLSTKEVHSHQP